MERSREDRTVPATDTLPERVPMSEFFGRLRSLVAATGPYLSCYLPLLTRADLERSREAVAAFELTEDEAAGLQQLISAGEDRARRGDSTDAMVVVLQGPDGHTFIEYYPEPVAEPVIVRTDVPLLSTVIEAEQRLRHHVVAVLTEDGLELLTFPRHGDPSLHRASETDIDRIAHLIGETVKTTGTRLVLLAGPDETIDELRRQLRLEVPIETAIEAVPTSTDDLDDLDDLADAAVQRVTNDRALHTVETLRGWRFERAHGQAMSDLVASVEALRAGDVRLLLITDDPSDQRQVWVGPEPQQLAIDLEDAAHALGDGELRPVRMADGLIRSAILQRIPVQIMPTLPDSTLPGGVGVLRQSSPHVTGTP